MLEPEPDSIRPDEPSAPSFLTDVFMAGQPERKRPKGDFNISSIDPMTHGVLDRRTIRITGEINRSKAESIVALMELLEDIDPDADIELRIDSPGGSVTAGLAIYDAIQNSRCDVRTVATGECDSMATVLVAAGTPGKRFATPNATLMAHGASAGMEGTVPHLNNRMKEINRLNDKIAELLVLHTGCTAQEIQTIMDGSDHFMAPLNARENGIIDGIRVPRHAPPANNNTRKADVLPPQPQRPQGPLSGGLPSLN